MAAAVPPCVAPPVEPMLARLARTIPEGPYAYEPKWDGFRCLAFVSAEAVELRSRHDRPLARYFPEIVEALRALPAGTVVDGELVAGRGPGGFGALLARLHPAASRVARLRDEMPARLVAFDCLADAGADVMTRPFAERRARLEALLRDAPPAIGATPLTRDPRAARTWLDASPGAGIDGVIAKALDLPYQPGRRAMVKVKRERTADCVVAGMRLLGGEPAVGSLLLGLYDPAGRLRHVGVSSSFRDARRRELFDELRPLATALSGHPWETGFNVERSPVGRLAGSAGRWDPREMTQDFVALRPARVCEVGYDTLDDGRFRHPGRFVRWRPDRSAASCTFDQLVGE